jgi:hypothetical protein
MKDGVIPPAAKEDAVLVKEISDEPEPFILIRKPGDIKSLPYL